jgi:hypothetical protein
MKLHGFSLSLVLIFSLVQPLKATLFQQAYVKASNTGSNDNFGQAIALSGDTLVVGAPYESSASAGVNGN